MRVFSHRGGPVCTNAETSLQRTRRSVRLGALAHRWPPDHLHGAVLSHSLPSRSWSDSSRTNDIQPFYAYSADIPEAFILKPNSYPARWKSRMAVSRSFGDAWLEAKTSPAILVPTVITPGEWNVLLNPLHPQFSMKWVTTGPDAYTFDARLLSVKKRARARRVSRG